MSMLGVSALTGALVHESVAPAGGGRGRHESFITHKLAISFAVLAVAPFCLAFRGVPSPGECLAFVWGLLPLFVAVFVARTGRLLAGRAILAFGLVGFALALVFAAHIAISSVVAWLVLAQWEAAASGDRRVILATSVAVGASIILVLASPYITATTAIWSLLSSGLAAAYAVTLAATDTRFAAVETKPARTVLEDPIGATVASFGDLAIAFDAGGSVDDVAGDSERLVALPGAELYGRGLFQIVHVADRPMFLKLIGDAACGDEMRTAVVRLRIQGENSGDVRFVWVEMRARRLALRDAGAPRVLAILRDVTAMQQHEQAVAAASRATETSLRSRDEFLANMSHELRTPLNAIIGFSEMLGSLTLRPTDPDKQREYAQIIHQSGQHLLSVVNSILDMSKIRSGTFVILPEPFDLRPLIDQCCDIVRLKAQEGSIHLVRDCPQELDELVGDRRACKQIIINLLSNAVKFTPANGEVKISARPEGNSIALVVSDTGIGIGADDLARIGAPFFQARSSFSRPFEGTGLGLSVVRGLVGLHGGTMTIESEPTLGTRVSIRLPLDCQAIADRGTSAVIETIPRRSAVRSPAHIRAAPETRIKSIA